MKIQIESSAESDYTGEILGPYIWRLEEGTDTAVGFFNTLEECFEASYMEMLKYK